MQTDSTPLLTGETARILKVGERSVRAFADRGILSVRRTPQGLRIFDRDEVLRLAADRARKKA